MPFPQAWGRRGRGRGRGGVRTIQRQVVEGQGPPLVVQGKMRGRGRPPRSSVNNISFMGVVKEESSPPLSFNPHQEHQEDGGSRLSHHRMDEDEEEEEDEEAQQQKEEWENQELWWQCKSCSVLFHKQLNLCLHLVSGHGLSRFVGNEWDDVYFKKQIRIPLTRCREPSSSSQEEESMLSSPPPKLVPFYEDDDEEDDEEDRFPTNSVVTKMATINTNDRSSMSMATSTIKRRRRRKKGIFRGIQWHLIRKAKNPNPPSAVLQFQPNNAPESTAVVGKEEVNSIELARQLPQDENKTAAVPTHETLPPVKKRGPGRPPKKPKNNNVTATVTTGVVDDEAEISAFSIIEPSPLSLFNRAHDGGTQPPPPLPLRNVMISGQKRRPGRPSLGPPPLTTIIKRGPGRPPGVKSRKRRGRGILRRKKTMKMCTTTESSVDDDQTAAAPQDDGGVTVPSYPHINFASDPDPGPNFMSLALDSHFEFEDAEPFDSKRKDLPVKSSQTKSNSLLKGPSPRNPITSADELFCDESFSNSPPSAGTYQAATSTNPEAVQVSNYATKAIMTCTNKNNSDDEGEEIEILGEFPVSPPNGIKRPPPSVPTPHKSSFGEKVPLLPLSSPPLRLSSAKTGREERRLVEDSTMFFPKLSSSSSSKSQTQAWILTNTSNDTWSPCLPNHLVPLTCPIFRCNDCSKLFVNDQDTAKHKDESGHDVRAMKNAAAMPDSSPPPSSCNNGGRQKQIHIPKDYWLLLVNTAAQQEDKDIAKLFQARSKKSIASDKSSLKQRQLQQSQLSILRQLVPQLRPVSSGRQSLLDTLEKTLTYIRELENEGDGLEEEENNLGFMNSLLKERLNWLVEHTDDKTKEACGFLQTKNREDEERRVLDDFNGGDVDACVNHALFSSLSHPLKVKKRRGRPPKVRPPLGPPLLLQKAKRSRAPGAGRPKKDPLAPTPLRRRRRKKMKNRFTRVKKHIHKPQFDISATSPSPLPDNGLPLPSSHVNNVNGSNYANNNHLDTAGVSSSPPSSPSLMDRGAGDHGGGNPMDDMMMDLDPNLLEDESSIVVIKHELPEIEIFDDQYC